MAASTITPTVQSSRLDGTYKVIGTLAWSPAADTYSTGGNTLNFALAPLIKASRLPLRVDIQGIAGYVYVYVPGTNAQDGKVKILTGAAAQSPLTELAAGAVPAGVSGDTITFKAEWAGML